MLKRMVILFVLFGSLALGFYLWDQSTTALQADTSVTGTFHEGRSCDNSSCSSTPYVTFETKAGTSIKFYPFNVDLSHQEFLAAFYDESTYHEGQSIPVLYDPSQPAQAFITSSNHLWMDALFWFILGGCILLGVLVASLSQDRKSPAPSRGPGPPQIRSR